MREGEEPVSLKPTIQSYVLLLVITMSSSLDLLVLVILSTL